MRASSFNVTPFSPTAALLDGFDFASFQAISRETSARLASGSTRAGLASGRFRPPRVVRSASGSTTTGLLPRAGSGPASGLGLLPVAGASRAAPPLLDVSPERFRPPQRAVSRHRQLRAPREQLHRHWTTPPSGSPTRRPFRERLHRDWTPPPSCFEARLETSRERFHLDWTPPPSCLPPPETGVFASGSISTGLLRRAVRPATRLLLQALSYGSIRVVAPRRPCVRPAGELHERDPPPPQRAPPEQLGAARPNASTLDRQAPAFSAYAC